ncbi:hypothetical protein GCM10007108_14770 [Thermogymnomonas acidicola]|uniref:Uncharacterized protein n=1 Tax=Thermogymnomonas acidicola TaxID=399579 RepID=A0AA37BSS6_9ARCH|nr:hypothetical protein [Thermogymnomonas acidicola]GGM77677.1 hypothetical protein GCM10007108_14770 [Thermogymnomonas acidicola]
MRNWSGHIYFKERFEWKSLEKSFPEIWERVASETKQNQEEAQYDQVALELNMNEIRKNKKPIGYFKEGAKYRMVFPSGRKELIIYRGMVSEEIKDITEDVAKILKSHKVQFSVDYDKMLLYEIKKRKK